MEYQNRKDGDQQEAILSGNLTFDDMTSFRQLIVEFQNASAERWVMDLRNLDFIDSAGLGLLLRLNAAAETCESKLSLRVSPEGKVKNMMDVAQFDQVIPFEHEEPITIG